MNSILLVIDVQNGFQRTFETKETAMKINNIVKSNLFDKIISTKFINRPDSPYSKWFHWDRLTDEPDIDLLDVLKIKSDFILEKYFYNCNFSTFVSALKDCNDGVLPKCVFICGTDTDCCVQINATTLFELGIHPIILTDYCASNGGIESHKAGIIVMRRTLGKNHLIDGEIHSRNDIEDIYTKIISLDE